MSNGDKVTGKAKEAAGKVTDDEQLEGEGKTQHAKGKVEETVDDAKSGVKGAWEATKDAVRRD